RLLPVVHHRSGAPPHPPRARDNGRQLDRRSQEAGHRPQHPAQQDAAVAGPRSPNGVIMNTVLTHRDHEVLIVTINRSEVRNAVDPPTAEALFRAFQEYDEDDRASVPVLTGAGGTFCARADLKAIAADVNPKPWKPEDARGPLEATRSTPPLAWPTSWLGSRSAASARTGCPPTSSGLSHTRMLSATSSGAAWRSRTPESTWPGQRRSFAGRVATGPSDLRRRRE